MKSIYNGSVSVVTWPVLMSYLLNSLVVYYKKKRCLHNKSFFLTNRHKSLNWKKNKNKIASNFKKGNPVRWFFSYSGHNKDKTVYLVCTFHLACNIKKAVVASCWTKEQLLTATSPHRLRSEITRVQDYFHAIVCVPGCVAHEMPNPAISKRLMPEDPVAGQTGRSNCTRVWPTKQREREKSQQLGLNAVNLYDTF